MNFLDWGAVRAYSSPISLTTVAIYSIWKDASDYRARAKEDAGTGPWHFVKRRAVEILTGITLLAFLVGVIDIHSTRTQIEIDKRVSDEQIKGLEKSVQQGNEQQAKNATVFTDAQERARKEFERQFGVMSDRVADLQTQVRTADLQTEAAQLRQDLEATRKSLDVPQTKLSFSLIDENGKDVRTVLLSKKDGAVHVKFVVANETDVTALEGGIVLIACDKCKIVTPPSLYSRLTGAPENAVESDFQHVFAKSRLPVSEVVVEPPFQVSSFQIGIQYRCKNCELKSLSSDPINPKEFPPNLVGIVFLAP